MTLRQSKITLADATKKRLKSLTIELRRLLEEDLGKQLKRLGIDPDKPAPVSTANLSYLTEEEQAIRRALDAVLIKEQAMAGSYIIAVESLRREATYTHLNRLVGLKCLELRGHLRVEGELTEVVTCRPEYGGRSKWLWTLREREKKYRYGEDAEEFLWREGLLQACAAVTIEIRVLFDPDDPYAQVWPSHKALRETVDKLNELPEEAFRADELLGWIYQYFQSEEKDRVFEEARTKKKKITWQDIVPVTQLYTERYMVDFLLQNSIGTRWMEMYPDSDAKADWPYYVTPATPHTRSPKALREWRILDPCVGSGHFLIVAFDLLAQLYAEERKLAEAGRIQQDWTVPANEVAVTILERNLHGIDIDPRAVQIAALALYLKGKEHGLGSGGRSPVLNLVVADAVLTRGPAYEELLSQYKQDIAAREAIEAIWHALENLRELGSLVRVEEEVEEAVRKAKTREDRHSPLLSSAKDWEQYKTTLLTRLKEAFVGETKSDNLNERIFGLEGVKSIGLLELLSRRYDVVCTNPPYMGSHRMGQTLLDFLRSKYTGFSRDMYAAFLKRCHELRAHDGTVAIVTMHGFMFLSSYEKVREYILSNSYLRLIAHLGKGAFEDLGDHAPAVLSCFDSPPEGTELKTIFLDCTSSFDKTAPLMMERKPLLKCQSQFKVLPGIRWLYQLDASILDIFQNYSRFEEKGKQLPVVRRGLDTGDVSRFVRTFWEIRPGSKGWYFYCKGNDTRKWYGNSTFVVLWSNGGLEYKAFDKAIIPNEELYFQEGLTFSRSSGTGLNIRLLPSDTLIGCEGPGIFTERDKLWPTFGFLGSVLVEYLASIVNPSMHYQTGDIAVLPHRNLDDVATNLSAGARLCWTIIRGTASFSPTDGAFIRTSVESMTDICILDRWKSWVTEVEASHALLALSSWWIDYNTLSLFGLPFSLFRNLLMKNSAPGGFYPLLSGYDSLPKTPPESPLAPSQLLDNLARHQHVQTSAQEIVHMKERLHLLYTAKTEDKTAEYTQEKNVTTTEGDETEDYANSVKKHFAVSAETYLAELAQKLEIHALSIYWLLEEMRREEGLVSPHELKRHTEDYFSVKVLRMLGHRWPMQDEYEKEEGKLFIDPKWVDEDGIIPLTAGTGEETLSERFHRFLDDEFTAERGPSVEIEAGQILGWRPGDEWGKEKATTPGRWFEREFFKRHISQFKRRPIAWHLTSKEGTFQVIVYYHKFNKNRLTILRARQVREVLETLRKQLGEAQSGEMDRQTLAKIVDLEKKIADIQDFDERLRRLLEGRDREARIWCPWKKPEEQPVGWNPDINDGVRVNIAPVQRLGLLATDVLATKDLKSLLAPEGRN